MPGIVSMAIMGIASAVGHVWNSEAETFTGANTGKVATVDDFHDLEGIIVKPGQVAYINGTPYYKVTVQYTDRRSGKKKRQTGYASKSQFDDLNTHTISIPANFAGLEAEMVPTRLMDQLFRIYEVVETEDYVEVTARHVWYDNLKNFTTWEVAKADQETSYSAGAVMRNVLLNTISASPSSVATDCTDAKKGSEFDYRNKNLVEVFLDPEGGICAKFGLVLIRDNWDFYCLKSVGYDRGFVVENGKNLLGVERTESIENVATRVAPIGKDKKGNIVWLNNNGVKYVDSTHIGDYAMPFVELYDTGIQIGKDGTTDANIQAKLLEAGQKRFSEDHVDIPEVEMTIEFLSLGDTEEYAQYRGLDKVYLYDIITIHDTVRGYDYTAQVVGIEHDVLTGMLNYVTIGKLNNWDGTRKIATWQVPEVSGENIRLLSIREGAFAPGAINGDDIATGAIAYLHLASATIDSLNAETIDAVTANIQTIIAGKIRADSIDTAAISAINATLGTATITNGVIDNADIMFANIKAATAESLIARDAVTDRYFIDKLMVRNAQMVQATVGELVIKASDNNYYRLDVSSNGSVTPTQVTLTAEEIASGVTSDGHGSIIETDLTVADLSASNMKAVNALIDKLTAARIDVSELWARQAFINQLMVTDISSNTYIQSTIGNWTSGSTITQTINSLDSRISSLGYGTVYMQPEEPSHSELVPGDIWIQTQASGTWEQVYQDYASWSAIYNGVSTWQTLGGVSIMWVWDGRKWQKQLDNLDSDTFETEIAQNAANIQLLANRTTTAENNITSLSASLQVTNNAIAAEVTRATTAEGQKYSIQSGIAITAQGIDISGSQYVKIASGGVFSVKTGNFGIDTESNTYVIWSGASTAASSPFWVKKSGEIFATSGTVGGFTLAANSLSSGSGAGYVNINSNTSNTYAMWAGAELAANAPFRIKRDGTVYLTSLIAVGENGSETTVNLRTAGLWKLGYATVKSLTTSGGYCSSITFSNSVSGETTVNFSRAASVDFYTEGPWTSGSKKITLTNGKSTTIQIPEPENWQATGFSADTKNLGIRVNVGDKNFLGVVNAESVYNTGWNACRNSANVLGTVYTITAHQGDWVKVQEVGTGYTRPAAKQT